MPNRIVINYIDKDYVKDFMYEWNERFPIDRWWRQKHKIAFNSAAHREVSFLDMRFEFEEELTFAKADTIRDYTPNISQWLNQEEEDYLLTEEERLAKYKKEFESMDLSQYND